ncbi:triple tyrosine motif-containing protein [Clostridium brassicae]|uniref:Two component regulator three Y domain-containing protein n=1 Tax=Clostridium brassicae TaxID=2999072 RepID=A0ABT4DGC2_9CLOT|nr:triple tyrosine motif-containing protein [Clostridium brassicae]MCY6960166.1 hypothetical protein [Clostridium brassicae]
MRKLKNTMLLLFTLSICILFTNIEAFAKVSSTQIQSFNITPVSKTSDYVVGKQYKVTAKATSTNNPEYRFWVGNLKTGKWKILKDYSTSNTITWTPAQAGRFEVSVHVRDKKSKVAYEAVKFQDMDVLSSASKPGTSIKTTIQNLSIEDLNGNYKYIVGNKCKINANAVSTNGPEYKFWVSDLKKGDRKLLRDYSENSSITWTPTSKGKFEIVVYVRDKRSKLDYECINYKDIEVVSTEEGTTKPTVKTAVKNFSVEALNGKAKYTVGNKHKVTANAVSVNSPQYRFWLGDLKTGKWKILKDYSSTNTITWTPTQKGRFEVSVHVRDSKSKAAYEAVKFEDIDIISTSQGNTDDNTKPGKDTDIKSPIKTTVKKFSIDNLDGDPKYIVANRYKVTADALSTNNPQYRFWVGNLDTGKWQILKDYSATNTITWVPTSKGRFEVSVHVRDSKSKAAYEAVKFEDIFVDSGAHTQSRKQSQLQTNLVNYLLASKSNRDSVMKRAIELHDGDESNTCVYFTSEALRRAGLKNLPTYVCNTRQLSTKLTSYGWAKCTDYTKLLPGDLCFSINGGTGYPTHVYTFVSWVKEGDYVWANIVDNQRSRFNGEPLHKRTIIRSTELFDKFQYFMYKPR